MKKHIPNLITLLNVLCGCIATIFAVSNTLELTAVFVFLGIFFDFFDGLAARMLRVQSTLGLQLDSLADMITSGLVPGIVMFQLLKMSLHNGWDITSTIGITTILPFFGFMITMASAYRLAKFNIDENQSSSFIGLPTPANALLILSLPLILLYHSSDVLNTIILNKLFLVGLTILSSYLLNANIPLFALKFKKWSFKGNEQRYLFIILSFVLLVTTKFIAIPVIIGLYVLMSLVGNIKRVE